MKAGQDQSQHQHNQHNQQTKQDFNSSEQNHKYIIAFSFHNTLSLKLLLEMLRLLLVCHFQEQLPPRIHWIHWLCGLPEQSEVWLRHANHDNQYTSIKRNVRQKYSKIMYQQTMHESECMKQWVRLMQHSWNTCCEQSGPNAILLFASSDRKACKSLQVGPSRTRKRNTEPQTRWSLDVGITRASKRSTLTCCETTTTESSKLLKAFWLHKNKAISFGCLGTNASSGHSLQMTNEHAGKLLAKPTASYVCSKSLKPLQAIQ